MYNTKNYMEQDGEKLHIGGTLEIADDATVTGLAANPLTPATTSTLGGVKVGEGLSVESDGTLSLETVMTPAEYQADAEAAGDGDDTVKLEDFNALLAKLQAAGLMEAE